LKNILNERKGKLFNNYQWTNQRFYSRMERVVISGFEVPKRTDSLVFAGWLNLGL